MQYFQDLEFLHHGKVDTECRRYNRRFDYWTIQYSQSGPVRLRIDDGEEQAADGACAFVTFPGSFFSYGPAEGKKLTRKVYLCFRGERVKRWIAGGLLQERRANALLSMPDGAFLLERLRRIQSLLILPKAPEHHARAVLLLEEVLLAMRLGHPRSRHRNDRLFPLCEELTGRIAGQPGLPWDFAEEARKLGVSYAHFRRLFRDFFGIPPGAYLLESRIQQAAVLLAHTRAPVAAVAQECGFADEFYFSRIFKKYRQMAPKLYRETFRND